MYCRIPGGRRNSFLAGVIGAALLLAGCNRQAASSGAERIAVLRFENLSADGSISWIGRAFSEVVATQLASGGSQVITSVRLHSYDRVLGPRPVSAPGISAESPQAIMAGATRVMYGEYTSRRGRLEVRVTLEDPAHLRAVRVLQVSVNDGDVLQAADEVARAVNPKAGPYPSRSNQAVAAYVRSIESTDAAAAEQDLRSAIQADPDMGIAYRLLSQRVAQRGDAAGAGAIVEQALARGSKLPADERARLELQAADLAHDLNGRAAALQKLVAADPRDFLAWRALGEFSLNRHDNRKAVESLQKAAELDPTDADSWNLLGYAAARNGDLTGATTALKRYQALVPGSANPLDSLGDIYYTSGKLEEGEKLYLQAFQKDPNFLNQGDLLKAAIARLFSGDLNGADQAANRYFDARAKAKDPLLEYRRAQWFWLTGRRQQGFQQMQAFADGLEKSENPQFRDASARANAEISLWRLMLDDRTGAQQFAAKALRIAGPAARGNALVAAFMAQPPASASEWTVRAEQTFGGAELTSIRNFALSYALLVGRQYHPAYLLFKQAWESGSPVADEGLPVMLAWTLIEEGKFQEAAPLLRFNPVASANGLTPYASFYIPRIFYLRGVLAQKEGRGQDAGKEFQRFLTLSGDTPLLWGEEKRARQ